MPVMSFIVFPARGKISEAVLFCRSIEQSQCLTPDQSEHEVFVLTVDCSNEEEISEEIKKVEAQSSVAGVSLVSVFSEEEMSDGVSYG